MSFFCCTFAARKGLKQPLPLAPTALKSGDIVKGVPEMMRKIKE